MEAGSCPSPGPDPALAQFREHAQHIPTSGLCPGRPLRQGPRCHCPCSLPSWLLVIPHLLGTTLPDLLAVALLFSQPVPLQRSGHTLKSFPTCSSFGCLSPKPAHLEGRNHVWLIHWRLVRAALSAQEVGTCSMNDSPHVTPPRPTHCLTSLCCQKC